MDAEGCAAGAGEEHTRGQETFSETLPSLYTIQQSAEIQERVHNIYQELGSQVAQPQGTVEEFVEFLRKKSDKNKEKLIWPQEHDSVGITPEMRNIRTVGRMPVVAGFS